MITIEHVGITAKLVRPVRVGYGCTLCVFKGKPCDALKNRSCVTEKGGTYWVPTHQQTEGVQDA